MTRRVPKSNHCPYKKTHGYVDWDKRPREEGKDWQDWSDVAMC